MMRHDDMTQLKLVSWWSFCPTYWLVLCPSFQASALEWCWPVFHVYHPSCLHGAQCSGAKGWTGPRTCSTFTWGTASSTGGAASLSFGVVRRYKMWRADVMTAQPSHHCFCFFLLGVQLSILASVILEEKQRKKASKYAKKRQLKKEVQIVETTPAESDEGEIWGMAWWCLKSLDVSNICTISRPKDTKVFDSFLMFYIYIKLVSLGLWGGVSIRLVKIEENQKLAKNSSFPFFGNIKKHRFLLNFYFFRISEKSKNDVFWYFSVFPEFQEIHKNLENHVFCSFLIFQKYEKTMPF